MQSDQPTPSEIECALHKLCDEGNLRRPDRIEYQAGGDPIAFWDEEKVAVIIEMDS